MAEPAKDPTTKELLREIRQLKANVEALSKKFEVLARQQKDHDEIQGEMLKLLEGEIESVSDHVCERLKKLEMNFAPQASTEISEIH